MDATQEIRTSSAEDEGSGGDKVLCGICRRQFARYTCPTCNVSYCSLTCFRSEAHSQCSETFYRKEIETGINSESSKTAQERMQMLELLKRMESQASEEDNLYSEDDDENDDLARRLANVDISSASSNDLLALLTKEERDKFFKALRDPSSELAQQLLASEELQKGKREPWWEAPSTEGQGAERVRYGDKPAIMDLPIYTMKLPPNAYRFRFLLLQLICPGSISYAYATRHLAVSPLASPTNDDLDMAEARRLISQTVPFIVDRKSRLLYTTLASAVTDTWSQFTPGTMNAKLLSLLLRDVATILDPRRVTLVTSHKEHSVPSEIRADFAPGLALSDMARLFEPAQARANASAPRHHHVAMKLTFYAAHLLSVPPTLMRALADEVRARSEFVEQETDQFSSRDKRDQKTASNPDIVGHDHRRGSIEELA
ncbi:hypothetical protein BV22DRAFT_1106691 [Leucogyrophana mollusca]|uniref:Uncharacterized protein n=1 Tax=Leucogyrophana mollusca TaxID=85980 RepID=A0ACB8B935_9AGAM|nr:hypothetical protein BV22DRAFT_1106691 [Leucogyrophana mollusca]